MTSGIPVKIDYFATVKNCNYLPNVLMKKDAVERGVDFSVSLDENGFLAEGSTENVGIVTKRANCSFRVSRALCEGLRSHAQWRSPGD